MIVDAYLLDGEPQISDVAASVAYVAEGPYSKHRCVKSCLLEYESSGTITDAALIRLSFALTPNSDFNEGDLPALQNLLNVNRVLAGFIADKLTFAEMTRLIAELRPLGLGTYASGISVAIDYNISLGRAPVGDPGRTNRVEILAAWIALRNRIRALWMSTREA